MMAGTHCYFLCSWNRFNQIAYLCFGVINYLVSGTWILIVMIFDIDKLI